MARPGVPVIADDQTGWNRRVSEVTGRLGNRISAIIAATPHTAPTTITGNYTVLSTDRDIINNKSGSACSITLGTATAGRRLTIKTIQAQTVVSHDSNVVPLAGGAAGTAILAATAGKWAELVGDGTNWNIMAAG